MKSKQIQSNRTGIYLRLSKDDERAGESISIENQRLMLTKYVEEKGWKIAGEYVDDGYTGTNFDRPEVQRMIDDVHMGRLDIVIVKDLSRFGRNYIEVGRYIDYEFPLYNIRFIALSDNIDTANILLATERISITRSITRLSEQTKTEYTNMLFPAMPIVSPFV